MKFTPRHIHKGMLTIQSDCNIKIPEDKLVINGIEEYEKFIKFVSRYCEQGIDLYLPRTEFHFKLKTTS
jgi:hypothetical protein